MKKYFILIFLCGSTAFCAQAAFSQIQPFPKNYSADILNRFTSCFVSKHNLMFLNWRSTQNEGTAQPWYAIYNCTKNTFSLDAAPLEALYSKGATGIFNLYNPKNDIVFICWCSAPLGDSQLYYSIYDCKNRKFISNIQLIPESQNSKAPTCSYNPHQNCIFITWSGSNNYPTYAIFDCNSMSFSKGPTKLFSGDETSPNIVGNLFNPETNQYIIGWVDDQKQKPYYAIFEAAAPDQTLSPKEIPNPENYQLLFFLGTLISNNQAFLYSIDPITLKNVYAIYNFHLDTFTTVIQPLGNLSSFDLFPVYLKHNNTVLLLATPAIRTPPSYAIFDCKTNTLTTEATPIDNNYNINSYATTGAYNSRYDNVFITWNHEDREQGSYCLYYDLNARAQQLMQQSKALYQIGTNR